MKYLAKIAALIMLSAIGIGSLPVLGDEVEYHDYPGIVLSKVTPEESLILEKIYGPLEINSALESPTQTNLLHKTPFETSSQAGSDAMLDGLLHQTHTSGCHKRKCMLRCPRCRVATGATFSHCKTPSAYYNCTRRIQ